MTNHKAIACHYFKTWFLPDFAVFGPQNIPIDRWWFHQIFGLFSPRKLWGFMIQFEVRICHILNQMGWLAVGEFHHQQNQSSLGRETSSNLELGLSPWEMVFFGVLGAGPWVWEEVHIGSTWRNPCFSPKGSKGEAWMEIKPSTGRSYEARIHVFVGSIFYYPPEKMEEGWVAVLKLEPSR